MAAGKRAVEILVVGGGLTGLTTGLALKRAGLDVLVVEAGDQVGGLCSTVAQGPWLFDQTGHWLHLRTERVRGLVLDVLGGPDHLLSIERRALIWSSGRATPYPFQNNLHGLPPQVVKECLLGIFQAQCPGSAGGEIASPSEQRVANFEDFILQRFGAGIARHFMLPYNERLWGVHPRELSPEWCGRFVPTPDLEEVVAGAVGCSREGVGYNARFHYPATGGIGVLAEALAAPLGQENLALNSAVVEVDPRRQQATLSGGECIGYEHLISTTPLPKLARMLKGLSDSGRDAAGELRWTSVPYLNVGVDNPAPNHGAHWIYYPEWKYPFYRVGCFSNAIPHMAPAGGASLYVELASREPFLMERDMGPVTEGMVDAGILSDANQVLFAHSHRIPVAYVVFDHQYTRARGALLGELASLNIKSIGRYGSWVYDSMEDAMLAGLDAAEEISSVKGGS